MALGYSYGGVALKFGSATQVWVASIKFTPSSMRNWHFIVPRVPRILILSTCPFPMAICILFFVSEVIVGGGLSAATTDKEKLSHSPLPIRPFALSASAILSSIKIAISEIYVEII